MGLPGGESDEWCSPVASVWNLVVGVRFRNLTYRGVFLGSCSCDLLITLWCFAMWFVGDCSWMLQWQWHVLSLPLEIRCSLSLSCSIVWLTVFSTRTRLITFGACWATIFNLFFGWTFTLNLILLRSIYWIFLSSWLLNSWRSRDLSSNCLCLLSLLRIKISLLIATASDVASVGFLVLTLNCYCNWGSLSFRVTLEEFDGMFRNNYGGVFWPLRFFFRFVIDCLRWRLFWERFGSLGSWYELDCADESLSFVLLSLLRSETWRLEYTSRLGVTWRAVCLVAKTNLRVLFSVWGLFRAPTGSWRQASFLCVVMALEGILAGKWDLIKKVRFCFFEVS